MNVICNPDLFFKYFAVIEGRRKGREEGWSLIVVPVLFFSRRSKLDLSQ